MAEVLDVDLSVVSRRLNGAGNVTLRTISDTYTAMDREPLSNFLPPRPPVTEATRLPSMKQQEPEFVKGQDDVALVIAGATAVGERMDMSPTALNLLTSDSNLVKGASDPSALSESGLSRGDRQFIDRILRYYLSHGDPFFQSSAIRETTLSQAQRLLNDLYIASTQMGPDRTQSRRSDLDRADIKNKISIQSRGLEVVGI
jgi:hypothetical protein